MAHFTSPLSATKLDARMWRVNQTFKYYSDFGGFVRVEGGFETDFASIPRFLWTLAPPDGRYTQAAVVHDWLYTTQTGPKDMADRIFKEAMEVLGVPRWKRNLMYMAVKCFGRYRKHGKDGE